MCHDDNSSVSVVAATVSKAMIQFINHFREDRIIYNYNYSHSNVNGLISIIYAVTCIDQIVTVSRHGDI